MPKFSISSLVTITATENAMTASRTFHIVFIFMFNYLFFCNNDKKNILQGMKSISDSN